VGLARDGKTNDEAVPNLLRLAVFTREFADVIVVTKPVERAEDRPRPRCSRPPRSDTKGPARLDS
jgi:hypothetical protein